MMVHIFGVSKHQTDGIFFVNTSQNKKHFVRSAFCFGTMCSACAERDAPCVRDVAFGSDVRFARELTVRTHAF